jgi:chloramphenicol 3-O phosphotransferase
MQGTLSETVKMQKHSSWKWESVMPNEGKIIFLNGTSSSGKTSLSKELLSMLEEEYCYLSLDEFMNQMNQAYLRLFDFIEKESAETVGIGQKIINKPKIILFHTTIKALCAMGKNVIVDHVLFNKGLLDECLEILEGYTVFFAGVHCPLHELERRELERGNRRRGLAKSQYNNVHNNIFYDINVNTYEMTLNQCAEQIKAFMNGGKPTAFKKLRETMK